LVFSGFDHVAGTLLLGLVTVVLLPWGTYQALSAAFLPPAPNQFNSGVADTLGGGLAGVADLAHLSAARDA